jgi:hypothetical protein
MRNSGWKVLAAAFLLAVAGGVAYVPMTAAVADADCAKARDCRHGPDCAKKDCARCCREHCRKSGPGNPCEAAPCAGQPCPKAGCEECYPKDAGQAGAGAPCAKHEAMHGKAGGPPMKAAMGKHLGEVRQKIAKLREVEAKMATQVKDADAFRASSLEHAKLLTDLQESHLKHMEGMTGGGQADRNMK